MEEVSAGPRGLHDEPSTLDLAWFQIAVVYFAVAVGFGVWMGASANLALYSAHSHLNLLGWVSLALTGLIYRHCPAAARTRLATAHFWLYNAALPPMMIALALKGFGNTAMEPVLAVSSGIIVVAVLLFAANILSRARKTVEDRVQVR